MIEHNSVLSDTIDFVESKKHKLEDIKKMDIDNLCNLLIEEGIFKNEESIKLYLYTRGLSDIENEEFSYPITFSQDFEPELDELATENSYALTDNLVDRINR